MQPLTNAPAAPRNRTMVAAGRLSKRFAQRRAATITDAQIEALRGVAVKAIDVALIYLCDLAVGRDVDPTDYVLGNDEIRVLTRDPAQARRDCRSALDAYGEEERRAEWARDDFDARQQVDADSLGLQR